MVLEAILEQDGHVVEKAHDGRAALELIRSGGVAPDLVLLDLFMPQMGGKAVVENMRADAELCRIPVVIITGSTLTGRGFPAAGSYQALITKPFDLSQVLECVRSLLSRKRTPTGGGNDREYWISQAADLA